MTRARAQLIGSSSCLMRKRELDDGRHARWRKKLRANRRTSPFRLCCDGCGILHNYPARLLDERL
jgi:hypothetical protein